MIRTRLYQMDDCHTSHQLHDVLIGFHKDHMHMLRITFIQCLLKIATSVLVFAKHAYLTLKILKLDVRKTRTLYRSFSRLFGSGKGSYKPSLFCKRLCCITLAWLSGKRAG